jgi:hypothetical protein
MRLTLNATAAERFWPKVDMTGDCWTWTARRDVDGYGRFRPDGANVGDTGAHRVALALSGVVLDSTDLVCHHCDNPPCVRPSHLFVGAPIDNTADMMRKGRHRSGNTTLTAARGARNARALYPERTARGERSGQARFKEDDIREMRAAYAGGETQVSIAKRYGTAQGTISYIVLRKGWKHVD